MALENHHDLDGVQRIQAEPLAKQRVVVLDLIRRYTLNVKIADQQLLQLRPDPGQFSFAIVTLHRTAPSRGFTLPFRLPGILAFAAAFFKFALEPCPDLMAHVAFEQ